MNNRIISTLFITTGLMLASASVFASKSECDHGWSAEHQHDAAHFEKHLAKLHDSLKLTSAQEPAWTEFASKMKPVDMGKHEMDKSFHQDWKDMSTPDRLDKMLGNMKSREAKMAEHAGAVRAFYGALTPDQQKTFDHQFMAYRHNHHAHGRYIPTQYFQLQHSNITGPFL